MIDEHVCLHEKEIILAIDHIKDIGIDTRKIDNAIYGNGKPGILSRMLMFEQSVKTIGKMQWLNTVAILSAAAKIVFFGG